MRKTTDNFVHEVHSVVKSIRPGSVMTYGEVARKAGKPTASRVVAKIMSENYDLDIPCHRVIRHDGYLSNYNRGGVRVKLLLLMKEGVTVNAETFKVIRK